MRYLKNEIFIRYDGSKLTLSDDEKNIPEHDASVAETLAVALRIYDTNHNRFVREGQLLSPTEIKSFNALLDMLDGADPGGQVAIESQDFRLLWKLVEWTVTTSQLWRDAPIILKLLERSTETSPMQTLAPNGAANLPIPVREG